MRSQWDCLLQNLGEWRGSFTRLSPQGEVLEDTPTVVSLESLNNDQTMRQIIRRFQPSEVEEKVLEYSSLEPGILLFENGAFSQGAIQWGSCAEFGAELGFIAGNQRLRLVQLFNRDSRLDRLTLIREHLAETNPLERPPLTVEQLLGKWQGEAVTVYPDARNPTSYSTTLQLHSEDGTRLVQQLTFSMGESARTITSAAKINGNILHFEQGSQPVQVLLLPNGASATSPLQVKPRQAFFLEAGWLIQPDLRQRMIRSYGEQGEWVSLTLVTERKVRG